MKKHIPALDGLRGAAVLLVIACHVTNALHASTPVQEIIYRLGYAGWIGVDLFFALSGFLITGILLDAKGGSHYFSAFYARRTLRIFPLYFATLAILTLLVPLHWWYWAYAVNWGQVAGGGQQASPFHTAHFWSLAIEEQFYLVWPLLVLWLDRRTLRTLCVSILVVSPILRVALRLSGVSGWTVYVATPTHLDGLAIGALLCLVDLRQYARRGVVAGTIALCALFALRRNLAYGDVWMQGIGYSALAVLFGSLLIIRPAWSEWPALRFFGRYSYALYVVHPFVILAYESRWPVRTLGELGVLSATTLAVSTALALLSWHALEKHMLALKRYVHQSEPKATSFHAEPSYSTSIH